MTSLSNMLTQQNYKRPPMLDISFLLNDDQEPERSPSLSPSLTASPASVSSTYSSYSFPQQDYWEQSKENGPIKAKRRRANSEQLEVLNRVFDRTFFPSTQMRAELGRQLGMNPRTVQIWFQNRRQAMRTKERQRLIKLRNETKLKSV